MFIMGASPGTLKLLGVGKSGVDAFYAVWIGTQLTITVGSASNSREVEPFQYRKWFFMEISSLWSVLFCKLVLKSGYFGIVDFKSGYSITEEHFVGFPYRDTPPDFFVRAK